MTSQHLAPLATVIARALVDDASILDRALAAAESQCKRPEPPVTLKEGPRGAVTTHQRTAAAVDAGAGVEAHARCLRVGHEGQRESDDDCCEDQRDLHDVSI